MPSHTGENSSAASAHAEGIGGGSETSQPRATGSIAQPPGPAAAAVKQKPAAKSIVILDIKPWGMLVPLPFPSTCTSLPADLILLLQKTTRPTCKPSSPGSAPLGMMVLCGALRSSSQSDLGSRNCRSTWSLRMRRSRSLICRSKSKSWRTTCRAAMSLLCRSCDNKRLPSGRAREENAQAYGKWEGMVVSHSFGRSYTSRILDGRKSQVIDTA